MTERCNDANTISAVHRMFRVEIDRWPEIVVRWCSADVDAGRLGSPAKPGAGARSIGTQLRRVRRRSASAPVTDSTVKATCGCASEACFRR